MSNGCKCKCPDFKTHISGISFASTLSQDHKAERSMVRNHDAYKNLKAEGFQPKSLRNAAQLEARANDPREITEGKIMSKQKVFERNIVHDAMGESGLLKAAG